jgi:hypothetical protein
VDKLTNYWSNKFLTNTVLPIEELKSFENEYISDKFHVWNSSLPLSDPFRLWNSKIIVSELSPKISRLKKLCGRYGRKRRLNLQRSLSKTLAESKFPHSIRSRGLGSFMSLGVP